MWAAEIGPVEEEDSGGDQGPFPALLTCLMGSGLGYTFLHNSMSLTLFPLRSYFGLVQLNIIFGASDMH